MPSVIGNVPTMDILGPSPAEHSQTHDAAAKVVKEALSWDGKSFRPGQKEQCAPFVRYVFDKAGVHVDNATSPTDKPLLKASDPLGPSYANSFAGDDVGRRIPNLSQARPGDIVMFKNTYGDWPDGVITHVGIYVGDEMMIDRSTMAHPVKKRTVYTFKGGPCQIRRPRAMDGPTAIKTRIALEANGLKIIFAGKETKFTSLKIDVNGGACRIQGGTKGNPTPAARLRSSPSTFTSWTERTALCTASRDTTDSVPPPGTAAALRT